MGYTFNSLSKILHEKTLFQGKKVLTLGTLYPYVSTGQAAALLRRGLNVDVPKEQFSRHLFVEQMGAESCHSLDVSDYQQSEIICNLNHPLAQKHVGQYDVVFDGGTLEHLANLPMALTNIFGLLREGGIYYFGVPCNNWVDHGFFQFSPTFFADLCIDNPSLKLIALHVNTAERYYDWANQNSAFIHALITSRRKLNVGGIIQKTGEGVVLDLTQSKYRKLHADPQCLPSSIGKLNLLDEKGLPPSSLRSISTRAVHWFSDSSWIPLRIKEVTLNRLYKLKKKLFA